MAILEDALLETTALLDELHLSHMLIGGVAVGLWGEPRATLDVDLMLWVEADEFESTIGILAERLQVRTAQPVAFARQSRVLPVRASTEFQSICSLAPGRLRNRPSKMLSAAVLGMRRCGWRHWTICCF